MRSGAPSSFTGDPFSAFFASAMIIIFSENFGQPFSWYVAMVALIAAASISNPTARLGVTSAVVLFQFVLNIDDKANHSNFAAIIAIIALVGLVVARRRSVEPWDWLRPSIGWSLVALYAAAGFHKLNTGYLNKDESCSLLMLDKLASRGGVDVDPSGSSWLVLGLLATVAWEFGAPVALMAPRTRRIGVLIAVAAHGALATISLHDFSAIALACLTLFMPTAIWDRLAWPIAAIRGLAIAVGCGAIASALIFGRVRYVVGVAGMLLVGLLAILLAVACLWHWNQEHEGHDEEQRQKRVQLDHLVGVVLVLAFAALPYVGLRTGGTFNMFSNVRTEMGVENHLLLPDFSIFGYQDDVVEILETDAWWKGEPLNGLAFPVVEFEDFRIGAKNWEEPVAMRYRYDGVDYQTSDLANDEAVADVGWFERSVLEFRPIQMDGSTNRCRW